MCLSTVYRNTRSPETLAMKNVTHIACQDGTVIITDLMGSRMAIEGQLVEASLVDGYVVIQEAPVC